MGTLKNNGKMYMNEYVYEYIDRINCIFIYIYTYIHHNELLLVDLFLITYSMPSQALSMDRLTDIQTELLKEKQKIFL